MLLSFVFSDGHPFLSRSYFTLCALCVFSLLLFAQAPGPPQVVYFSWLGSVGSCLVVGICAVSAIPQESKSYHVLFHCFQGIPSQAGPYFPTQASAASSLPPIVYRHWASAPLVFLFLGLWTPRRPGMQPVSCFPRGPQMVTSYALYRICCFVLLVHYINFCNISSHSGRSGRTGPKKCEGI